MRPMLSMFRRARSGKAAPRRGARFRPRVEGLEDRVTPTVFTVTNTLDDGSSGSLRWAITQTNVDSDPVSTIDFDITGAGVQTVQVGSSTAYAGQPLPTITHPVVLDGYTQAGARANDLSAGSDAVLQIQLDLSSLPASSYGLHLTAGANGSTLRGLALNRSTAAIGTGVWLDGGSNNHVGGNFLGTDASGTQLPPDVLIPFTQFINTTPAVGILANGGTGNVIGGAAADCNLISGWHTGIGLVFGDSGNTVAGNLIGTNVTGTRALGNWTGIGLGSSANDRIEGNLISGNSYGIVMPGGGSTPADGPFGCVVQNNLIGTDVTGTSGTGADSQPIGNRAVGIGIVIGAHDNTITGNTIAFNGWSPQPGWGRGAGVVIINFRANPYDDRIEGNSIHDNVGLGIDLGGGYPTPGPDGVTPNDSQGHTGPNNFQDFPTLTAAASSATATTITGSFSETAEPNTTLTLDFYANTNGSATTYGQGETYLGSRTVLTDGSGNVSFTAAFALGNFAGDWISATATDPNGNTSEFSLDVQATASSQTFTQSLPAALPQSASGSNTLTLQANPTTINDVVTALAPTNLGSSVTAVSVYLNLAPGSYTSQTVSVPAGMTLYINGVRGTTIDPASPAFTLASGSVVVSNLTFITTGDAPTILVTGGSLTLRNCVVQESTSSNDAAISVTGGTVDLGTALSPGGNTINVNGAGTLVQNTASTAIAAVGDTFTVNGSPLTPSSLSGVVWEDFNDDGQVDFGETGISGVTITLTGTDFLGNPVNLSLQTDSDGAYVFLNLPSGNYFLTETPPAGYVQGIDSVGTAGGSLSATDQFLVPLGVEADGMNYNFGELPPAGGAVRKGQTAGIGFWNNKNGQALIKTLNGSTGTQLADWLATTLPNTFGKNAAIDVAGQSNAYIAGLFQQDFVLKGVKLDAQMLATALSVYATNATLDSTQVAASYGFTVSADGAGTATVNIGSNGDAFGVANNSTLTVMDLLLATDAQTVNGVLYSGNTTRRNEANLVYSAINQAGDIN